MNYADIMMNVHELLKYRDENIEINNDIKCNNCNNDNFEYLYSSNGYIKSLSENNYNLKSIKIETPNMIFIRCKNCNQEYFYVEDKNK